MIRDTTRAAALELLRHAAARRRSHGRGRESDGSIWHFWRLSQIRTGNEPMTNPWSHNWRECAVARLHELGYGSLFDFARERECAPYASLANELGGDELAPVQIQMLLREELENTPDFPYFVKSSLVRNLHEHVPNGVHKHGDWPLTLALSSWAGSMGESLQRPCASIARRLKKLDGISDDWIPASADDAVIEMLFRDVLEK